MVSIRLLLLPFSGLGFSDPAVAPSAGSLLLQWSDSAQSVRPLGARHRTAAIRPVVVFHAFAILRTVLAIGIIQQACWRLTHGRKKKTQEKRCVFGCGPA